jgi:hypothetical protein
MANPTDTSASASATAYSAVEDTEAHQFLINSFFGQSAFLTPTDSFLGQFLETPPAEQS